MSELRDVEAIRADLAELDEPHATLAQAEVYDRLLHDVEPLLAALAAAEARADEAEAALARYMDAEYRAGDVLWDVARKYLPDAIGHNTLPEIMEGIARQRDGQHEMKDHLADTARKLTERAERAEQQLRQVREQVADRDAKLAAVEALCDSAAANGAAARTDAERASGIRERHYAMGCVDGMLEAVSRVRAALSLSVPTSPQTDEPRVEIGGQSMTQAQFDAARYPLRHPNPGPVSPADEMSVSFPEQDEQQQCKHGNTEPHYMRFTTGTTAHCPGPVSLEQQETQQ